MLYPRNCDGSYFSARSRISTLARSGFCLVFLKAQCGPVSCVLATSYADNLVFKRREAMNDFEELLNEVLRQDANPQPPFDMKKRLMDRLSIDATHSRSTSGR